MKNLIYGNTKIRMEESIGKISDFRDTIPVYTLQKIMDDTQRLTETDEPVEAFACAMFMENDLSISADEILYLYYLVNVNDVVTLIRKYETLEWDLCTVGISSGLILYKLFQLTAQKQESFFSDKVFLPACVGLSLPYSFIKAYLPENHPMDPSLTEHDFIGILRSSAALPGDKKRKYCVQMTAEKNGNEAHPKFRFKLPKTKDYSLYSEAIFVAERTLRRTIES